MNHLNNDWKRLLTPDDASFEEIWERCNPFTMTSPERGLAMYRATRYVARRNLPGSIVECGVWKGGSIMIAMLALLELDRTDIDLYLYDTFDGMTEPSDIDVDYQGQPAETLMASDLERTTLTWARSTIDEVKTNVSAIGYPQKHVHYVIGDVRKTAGQTKTGLIALLRLDTDFYDSTKAELQNFYPRLLQHGVLIVDDYGHWKGSKKAVDEFFSDSFDPQSKKPTRPMFHHIDYTGVVGVRSEGNPPRTVTRYDYAPHGLENPQLLKRFPTLVPSDGNAVKWPHFRKNSPHIWRTDLRSQKENIGVLSIEEALILHNLARQFRGLPALEIGCHYGWSTAHLLTAGITLDVIDPALSDANHFAALEQQCRLLSPENCARLWAGFSPHVIDAVAATQSEPWSFVFIDGDHDGTGPVRDARAVEQHCADNAMVVFHDLASPAVAAGLHFFAGKGWSTRVYNTSQIMGCAWRGTARPVNHAEDSKMPDWTGYEHLKHFCR